MVAWVDGYEHEQSERAGFLAPLHGFGWLAAGLPVRSCAAEATSDASLSTVSISLSVASSSVVERSATCSFVNDFQTFLQPCSLSQSAALSPAGSRDPLSALTVVSSP
jgi:hypothetical protein